MKLAARLERVHMVAVDGVVKASAISRRDREVLQRKGRLTSVCRGWYLLQAPAARGDGSTAWYAHTWTFIRVYLTDRFGAGWCLSAEASLAMHSGSTTVPQQVVVITARGGSMVLPLPHTTSLLLYPDPDRLPGEVDVLDGLRIMSLPEALVRVSAAWFRSQPTDAAIAMRMVRTGADVARAAVESGRLDGVGRLIGAWRALGQEATADSLRGAVEDGGHSLVETNPFEVPPPRLGSRPRSLYAGRVSVTWERMRRSVLTGWPQPPPPASPEEYLAALDARAEQDAWHSLSIEGYRVTPELIRRVKSGGWRPEANATDAGHRDALAAAGYLRAHRAVRASVAAVLSGEHPGEAARGDLDGWHRNMFSPQVEAGLLKQTDLLGYRRQPVFIRGSRHVPPPHGAVGDAMEALFENLHAEPVAAVRAVLGHFAFTWIHPFGAGNGRLGRFLMNLQLASAGYPWTVVRVGCRAEYMSALEVASVEGDIAPFVAVIRAEMEAGGRGGA
jgi:hypothetical protein